MSAFEGILPNLDLFFISITCTSDTMMMYREVQLDFTPEIEYSICCLRDVIIKWNAISQTAYKIL